MKSFLNTIRCEERTISVSRQVVDIFVIILLGIALGTFSKFLGRLAIWVLLAVCISIYYLYSKFAAGFFPRSYAMIWVGFTAVFPLLAFILKLILNLLVPFHFS